MRKGFMKKRYKTQLFSDRPFIGVIFNKKYCEFIIDTWNTKWNLTKNCVNELHSLAKGYFKEKDIPYCSLPLNSCVTYWHFTILKQDVSSFWESVEKILMKQKAFIRVIPYTDETILEGSLVKVKKEIEREENQFIKRIAKGNRKHKREIVHSTGW